MSPDTSRSARGRVSIRIPGPSSREIEDQAAEYVELALRSYDDRDVGDRIRRDGLDNLRVDFTYDAVDPPVAMEITRLVEPSIQALGAELRKLEEELQVLADDEDLGSWMLCLRVGTRVAPIREPLIRFLRDHSVGDVAKKFGLDHAPESMTNEDLQLLNELFELGLVSAVRIGNIGNDVDVFPPVSDNTYEHGFQTLLRHAVAANAAKLGEARPRETHLVVIVDRSDVSAEPSLTPPLRLPAEIDTLWVLLGYFNAKYTYRLWRTSAESQKWDLLMHPLGQPRGTYPQTLDGMAG